MELDKILKEIEELKDLVRSLKGTMRQPAPQFLRTKAACSHIQRSENSLRALCIQYNVSPTKVGGINYYKISDLDRILSGVYS